MYRNSTGEGFNHPLIQPQMQRAIPDISLQLETAFFIRRVLLTEFSEITPNKDDGFGIFQMALALSHEHAFVLLTQVTPGLAYVLYAADDMHEIFEITDSTKVDTGLYGAGPPEMTHDVLKADVIPSGSGSTAGKVRASELCQCVGARISRFKNGSGGLVSTVNHVDIQIRQYQSGSDLEFKHIDPKCNAMYSIFRRRIPTFMLKESPILLINRNLPQQVAAQVA